MSNNSYIIYKLFGLEQYKSLKTHILFFMILCKSMYFMTEKTKTKQ